MKEGNICCRIRNRFKKKKRYSSHCSKNSRFAGVGNKIKMTKRSASIGTKKDCFSRRRRIRIRSDKNFPLHSSSVFFVSSEIDAIFSLKTQGFDSKPERRTKSKNFKMNTTKTMKMEKTVVWCLNYASGYCVFLFRQFAQLSVFFFLR